MSGTRGVPVHEHKRRRTSTDVSSALSTETRLSPGDTPGTSHSITNISYRPDQPRRTSASGKNSIANLLSTPSPPRWSPISYSGSVVSDLNRHNMEGDDKGSAESDSTPGSSTSVVLSQGSGSEPHSDWVFTLEVIQQPQRARACGFGDKDRRPLSPPPIIRLRVHTATGQPVDPSHVTIQFFVLLADLWSGDGTQERNVVMHPGSQIIRAPISESQVAGSSKQPSEPWSDTESSYPPRHGADFRYSFPILTSSASSPSSHHSESSQRRYPLQSEITGWSPPRSAETHPPRLAKPATSLPAPSKSSGSSSRPVTAPVAGPRFDFETTFRRPEPRRSTSSNTSAAGPSFQPPPLPTSSYFPSSRPSTSYSSQTSPSYLSVPPHLRPSSSRLPFSAHSSESMSPSSSMTEHTEMAIRPTSSSSVAERPRTATSAMSGISGRPSTAGARPSTGSSFPLPTTPTQPQTSPTYPSSQIPPLNEVSPDYGEASRMQIGTSATTPNYSRVLVGALGCICQRLHDEDGQPGLFFFAHDLGVRTEGTFRLRFRLTNLTSLMQVDDPARHESNLAEVFSEPFAVYSAKKFPGVIPTTELTRLFARQNVRLPTRQRRQGRARSEGDTGDEED